MESKKTKVLRELFQQLYSKENREEIELLIANLKAELEQLSGVNAFVTARVKHPISTIKKFYSSEEYSESWNRLKDLVGLMVVVDTNNDVDDILHYMNKKYFDKRNPNSKKLFKDYRVINIRDDHDKSTVGAASYDPLTDKGYQTCDGYKNVRVNLMIDGYPIEIQIKTKEQYVAHEATHDPVYKAPSIKDEKVRQEISDRLFPYFEAHAHMAFHSGDMSDREKEAWKTDVQEITDRNGAFYNKYREIFEDASRVYAYYLFMTNNMQEIYKDAAFGNNSLDFKLLEIEVKRIFHYLEKQISIEDPSLTTGGVFNATINRLAKMSYQEFLAIREQIAGSYRCEKCIVSGIYDLLRARDVELFKRLGDSFRYVEVAVFDDDLVEIFEGKPPMFTLVDRQAALRNIKGVSSILTVNSNGEMQSSESIEFMSPDPFAEKSIKVNIIPSQAELLTKKRSPKELVESQIPIREKQFEIGYLPGVFDMLHPGHVEYINQVCRLCRKVYIGSKSDEYVRIIKGKDPVLEIGERTSILKSIRGIEDVILTEFDITPSTEILKAMQESIESGKQCAIFMGSDWVDKPSEKSERSLLEYYNLVARYPNIQLISIPRGTSGRSSTKYKDQGLKSLGDVNPNEITILDR